MHGHLHASYAHYLEQLAQRIRNNATWPDAASGFAAYVNCVPVQNKLGSDLSPRDESFPVSRAAEAPVLAAYGYLLAASPDKLSDKVSAQWLEGFERLSQKEPLRADRQSFFYRPLELLGISLGVASCNSGRGSAWMREVLAKGRDEYNAGDPAWRLCLSNYAASLHDVSWVPPEHIKLSELRLEEMALGLWLESASRKCLSESGPTENRAMQEAVLRQTAVEETGHRIALEGQAVIYAVLQRLLTEMVEGMVDAYHDPARQEVARQEERSRERQKEQIMSVEAFCQKRGRQVQCLVWWIVTACEIALVTIASLAVVEGLLSIPGSSKYTVVVGVSVVFYGVYMFVARLVEKSLAQKLATGAREKYRTHLERKLLGTKIS